MAGWSRLAILADRHHAVSAGRAEEIPAQPDRVGEIPSARKVSSKDRPKVELPRDSSLKVAGFKMTKSAKVGGRDNLI